MNLIAFISSHMGGTGPLQRQTGKAEYSLPMSRCQSPSAPSRACTIDQPLCFSPFPDDHSLGCPPWNLPSIGLCPVQLDTLDLSKCYQLINLKHEY